MAAGRDSGKNVFIGVVVLVLAGVGFWIYKEMNRPLPGTEFADLGREHTLDIQGFVYNSNPPTSGKHFPVWAKPGVYDRVLSDGYLIHSLEHGYIVISYRCDELKTQNSKLKVVSRVMAHEGEELSASGSGTPTASTVPLMHMTVGADGKTSYFTPQNAPAVEVELSPAFSSDECKSLVSELSEFTKVEKRVVVVPRPNMDSRIAVTAWRRLLKLDTFEKDKITEFIKAYHNRGPEATVE